MIKTEKIKKHFPLPDSCQVLVKDGPAHFFFVAYQTLQGIDSDRIMDLLPNLDVTEYMVNLVT